MNRSYQRWAAGFLALTLTLLALCGAAVYAVDPCLYYRMPESWQPVFFSERYQAAGLVKNVPADTVVMGTSMTANYYASQAEDAFGGTALRITIPDGYFSEFDQVMGTLFRHQSPKRVVFGLDLNILIRDESGVTGAMPGYLYDQNPFNDVKYLLNKDTLYYSLYTLLANHWEQGETLNESFVWDTGIWWNHITALAGYERPEPVPEALAADAYRAHTADNLQVLEGWVRDHPETEFDVFLPPYSLLFWDRCLRLGELDARLAAVEQAAEALSAYENVKLHGLLFDKEIVGDLDYYGDYIHHSSEASGMVLERIAAGQDLLTAENIRETLAQWRDFVVNYDYEQFWNHDFWVAWNEAHRGPQS